LACPTRFLDLHPCAHDYFWLVVTVYDAQLEFPYLCPVIAYGYLLDIINLYRKTAAG